MNEKDRQIAALAADLRALLRIIGDCADIAAMHMQIRERDWLVPHEDIARHPDDAPYP